MSPEVLRRGISVFEALRSTPDAEKLRLRKEAAELLADPDFRKVKVTKIENIPGVQHDVTVAIGPMPSLGGWRFAPSTSLLSTYEQAYAADPRYTTTLLDRKTIPDRREAEAGVIEAERLATDMALKWAGMRATMRYAKEHRQYGEKITDTMVDTWIDSSKFSGGKSVVVIEREKGDLVTEDDRRSLIMQHATHIDRFNTVMGDRNHHVTAPDMGSTTPDMTALRFFTDDVASMAPEYGGSDEPSPVTARGVFHATKATMEFLERDGNAATFAVQGGAGEVANTYIRLLKEAYPDAKIFLSEEAGNAEKQDKVNKLASIYSNTTVVQGDEIFQQQDAIFVPSGPSAQLNDEHLEQMKDAGVAAVVGPANYLYPPYQEQEMSQRYHDANILVAPAPLVNQGGIRKIALGEFVPKELRPNNDIINESIADVGPMLKQVFQRAKNENKTPDDVFREIALDEFAALCVDYGILKPSLN